MTALFDTLLSVSVNSLWVIGAVLLVRALLTKRAKSMRMLLWALVALRLAIPFTLESDFSLIPEETVIELSADEEAGVEQTEGSAPLNDSQTVTDVPDNSGNTVTADKPVINELLPDDSGAVQAPVINDVLIEEPFVSQRESVADDGEPVKEALTYKEISIIIWLVGIALIACYHIGAHIALRLRLRDAYRAKDNIWRSDRIAGAFSYGVIKPKIYIPSFINGKEEEYIISHERAHISHGDHVYRLLAVVLLCVYWYNPLVWLSYHLFCRDLEFACDERVIRDLDGDGVKGYSKTLVKYSAGKRELRGMLLAFNKNSIKNRIANILNYKKPALWLILSCSLLCVVIVVCFMTVPTADGTDDALTVDNTDGATTETETTVQESTEEPTEELTEVPTEVPTEEPTEEPTVEPTEEPIEEPTETPSEPSPPTVPSKSYIGKARNYGMYDAEKRNYAVTTVNDRYDRRCYSGSVGYDVVIDDIKVNDSYDTDYKIDIDIVVFETFDEFKYGMSGKNFDGNYEFVSDRNISKYDSEYFEDNALVVLIDHNGGGSGFPHKITYFRYEDGELMFGMEKVGEEPGFGYPCDVVVWASYVEIPKSDLDGVDTFSIYASRLDHAAMFNDVSENSLLNRYGLNIEVFAWINAMPQVVGDGMKPRDARYLVALFEKKDRTEPGLPDISVDAVITKYNGSGGSAQIETPLDLHTPPLDYELRLGVPEDQMKILDIQDHDFLIVELTVTINGETQKYSFSDIVETAI